MNSRRDASPVDSSTAAFLLLLVLISLSHLYPQAAYPLHGIALGSGLWLVLLLACTSCWQRGRVPLSSAWGWIAGGAALAWPLWWGIRQLGAPIAAVSRPDLSMVAQGSVVFLGSFWCVVLMRDRWGEGGGEAAHVPPGRIAGVWLAVMVGLLAAYGAYQSLGPAWMPLTYRAQEEYVLGHPELQSPAWQEGILHALRERRAGSRLGAPNILAGLIAFGLPLLGGLLLSSVHRGAKVLWAGIFAACVVGLVLTGSRGGFLAGVFGLVCWGGLMLGGRRWGGAAMAGILSWLMMGAAGEQGELARRWLGGTTLLQRLHYWKSGFGVWSENWLLGAGPGAYEVFYPRFRIPGAQETVYAHNWVVQWGSETGLVGLVAFGTLVLGALVLGLRWLRKPGGDRAVAAGFLAACLTLLAHGLIEYTLSFREVHLDLALGLGVLAGMGTELSARPTVRSSAGRAWSVLAVAALLVTAGQLYHGQVRHGLSEFQAEIGESYVVEGAPGLAADHFTAALEWEGDRADVYESRGLARLSGGDAAGMDDLERALRLNPYSARLRQTMSAIERDRGNLESAIDWQREAVELHPLDVTHRLVLAELLWEDGQGEEARGIVEEIRSGIAGRRLLLISKAEEAHLARVSEQMGLTGGP